MLFPSILTGCLGPSGEFGTLLRCGPDVSAAAREDKSAPAPLPVHMGILGHHHALTRLQVSWRHCVGSRERRGKEPSGQT
ncbi:hypothetical protein P7K49_020884, partial [Saguinus oedipus]